MQLRKVEIRNAFLNQFTDEELSLLLYLVDKNLGTHLLEQTPRDQLRQKFPWVAVRRFLFSRFIAPGCQQRDFLKLTPAIPRVKAWLEDEAATIPLETFKALGAPPPPPPIPVNLRLTHPVAGVVPVTMHAWERFIERFEQQHEDPTQIAKRLQRLFERSRPTTIAVEHRVKRMISNNFEGAHYYAVGRHIRFVISETSGMLMTVEDPKVSR